MEKDSLKRESFESKKAFKNKNKTKKSEDIYLETISKSRGCKKSQKSFKEEKLSNHIKNYLNSKGLFLSNYMKTRENKTSKSYSRSLEIKKSFQTDNFTKRKKCFSKSNTGLSENGISKTNILLDKTKKSQAIKILLNKEKNLDFSDNSSKSKGYIDKSYLFFNEKTPQKLNLESITSLQKYADNNEQLKIVSAKNDFKTPSNDAKFNNLHSDIIDRKLDHKSPLLFEDEFPALQNFEQFSNHIFHEIEFPLVNDNKTNFQTSFLDTIAEDNDSNISVEKRNSSHFDTIEDNYESIFGEY